MPGNLRSKHRLSIETLRKMTPAQRLQISFGLTVAVRERYIRAIRSRYPHITYDEVRRLTAQRLKQISLKRT